MTHAPQLVGGRHAGRSAADDGHLLARIRAGGEFVTLLDGVIADVLLDRIDADEILDLVAIAPVLTGRGAHPPHHGRERIGVRGAAKRILAPVHTLRRLLLAAHDRQPAANIFARGATALTGGGLVYVGRAFV